jgi:hypothetical protein
MMRVLVLLTTTLLLLLSLGIASSRLSAPPLAYPERPVAQGATRFSSAYTSLTKCGSGMTKKEEQEAEARGSDIPSHCKGPDGYYLDVSYSACSSSFDVVKGDPSIHVAMQTVGFPQKTVEWRLADGKPFAVILRVYEYGGNDQCATSGKIIGSSLVVKGLKGYEQIDEEVDAKAKPSPNVKAREIADKGYAQLRKITPEQ